MVVKFLTHPGLTEIESIIRYHSEYYAATYGFNHEFGEYVRKPLLDLVERQDPGECVWYLKRGNEVTACIALARATYDEAQLRWYYVDEPLRGSGLGSLLLETLIDFARTTGYKRIFLWTVSQLSDARRMYERYGFTLEEEITHRVWGMELTEQKFVCKLGIYS